MTTIEKDRDWYKLQALLFQSYMGHLNKAEGRRALYRGLFEATAPGRRQALHEAESRRLRRSA